MSGWIKLSRCLLENQMFDNEKLLKVWVWCLLKASHKDFETTVGLQRVQIKAGQFITGRFKGAEELRLNPSSFWNYLVWLEKNESLDIKSNNKFSVVTLVNWEIYQGANMEDGQQGEQQNDNKMTTKKQQNNTNKNVKNYKNDKKIYIVPFEEIISYLNEKAGTNYRSTTKATKEHINARWEDGFTLEDFKKVIDTKVKDWKGKFDGKGNALGKYLRPQTLFSSNFESYLNQDSAQSKLVVEKQEEEKDWGYE